MEHDNLATIQDDRLYRSDTLVPIEPSSICTTETTGNDTDTINGNHYTKINYQPHGQEGKLATVRPTFRALGFTLTNG